jgi:tellurite resistance protein TerC
MLLAASESAVNYVDFDVPVWVWTVFVGAVVVALLVDLLLFHRTAHVITTREAAIESSIWIGLGLAFTFVIWAWQGGQAGGEYLAGYLIEKSLSVDNVFVWALILSYFAVPREFQYRALFWGIFGALVFRAIFIFAGVALLERFDWVIYVFGAILLFTAVRLLTHGDDEVHPDQNPVLRVFRRFIPTSSTYDGQKMFTRNQVGALVATPLFAVLVVIETSDVVFAVDSIPAILAVTQEEFVVFSSNALAILGLRALYFLLADLKDRFDYLRHGLAVILAFVGVKMLISEWYHIPVGISLAFIAVVLTVAIWVSIKRDPASGKGGDDAPDRETVPPSDPS